MVLHGIFGAGGFGREVMPVAREMLAMAYGTRGYELVFVVENVKKETIINGHRVISDMDFLSWVADTKYFNIAIADYKNRERIANKLVAGGVTPFSISAGNVIKLDENEIGEGSIFCPFTTVTSNTKIGRFFHCNIYSYVAHDCVIGDFVTFAPSVHCNGKVVIEDNAYIGTGAVIKQGTVDKPIVIGKGAIVGMGAVVTKSVDPFTTVVGNPAAPLKRRIA
ncbi:MAG: acetyltransferase [Deltaproteobacteria bacterium]|nr:acetyltransferase [Deltaproteobacteria bacterium]